MISPAPADADSIWRAPLLPPALAFTAGIVLDRSFDIFLPVSSGIAVVAVIAWFLTRSARGFVCLLVAVLALGAAHYHLHYRVYDADDIGLLAPDAPMPAQVAGFVEEEPHLRDALHDDPLRSQDRPESTSLVMRATRLRVRDEWLPVSGRLHVLLTGKIKDLHPGDEIEAVGVLSRIQKPSNPGELDQSGYWQNRRVLAQFAVRKTNEGLMRYERGWTASWRGWLAAMRGHGQRTIGEAFPGEVGGVAQALILGEGSTLGSAGWDKFVRTGVIHILVVAGHHLIVLGLVVGWILRRLGLRLRQAAAIIGIFLVAYAFLTGGHPPGMRAALTMGAICLGMVLRRRTLHANVLALAWLLVAIFLPGDLFSAGCQLSFLSVIVLNWGCRRPVAPEPDPLDLLVQNSRPWIVRTASNLLFAIYEMYRVTFLVWLAVTPLTAAHTYLVPLAGLVLLPPLMLLATLALLAGLGFLVVHYLAPPLAIVFIPFVDYPLSVCVWMVDRAREVPGSYIFVGDVPQWWLWPTYIGMLLLVTHPGIVSWRMWIPAALAWFCVGLIGTTSVIPPDELRVTFVAVGHGGCAVIETPDGRTLLYDAGAITGPKVAERHIAPFLWFRGIRRIDEVFLSHADLDHFNGLVDLLDRFPIGQVTCTPTFAAKNTLAVRHTLAELARRQVPVRVVKSGDMLEAGGVSMEVLHPPTAGPEGNENARSMVLLLRHAGHGILLTGDLEGSGQDRVLQMIPRQIHVLQAPHHNSAKANTEALASWAKPRMVVACVGAPRGLPPPDPYKALGASVLSTFEHGAVTVHSSSRGLSVETYVTRQRLVIRR